MKHYLKVLCILIVLVCSLFLCITSLAHMFITHVEQSIERRIERSPVPMTVPSVTGSSMGVDALYAIKPRSESKPNLYIIGNSQSLLGIDETQFETALDINLVNASMGSANLDSYVIMLHYLETINQAPKKGDLVIVDLAYSVFQNRPLINNVTASSLEYGDVYQVESDLSVKRPYLTPIRQCFALSAHKIANAMELLWIYLHDQSFDSAYQTPNLSFDGLELTLNLDQQNLVMLHELIEMIQSYGARVGVEILYQRDAFQSSQAGRALNDYLDTKVIESFDGELFILDHRMLMEETDFVDGNHLNRMGRQTYTIGMISVVSDLLEE